jgi:hypothetical protein
MQASTAQRSEIALASLSYAGPCRLRSLSALLASSIKCAQRIVLTARHEPPQPQRARRVARRLLVPQYRSTSVPCFARPRSRECSCRTNANPDLQYRSNPTIQPPPIRGGEILAVAQIPVGEPGQNYSGAYIERRPSFALRTDGSLCWRITAGPVQGITWKPRLPPVRTGLRSGCG